MPEPEITAPTSEVTPLPKPQVTSLTDLVKKKLETMKDQLHTVTGSKVNQIITELEPEATRLGFKKPSPALIYKVKKDMLSAVVKQTLPHKPQPPQKPEITAPSTPTQPSGLPVELSATPKTVQTSEITAPSTPKPFDKEKAKKTWKGIFDAIESLAKWQKTPPDDEPFSTGVEMFQEWAVDEEHMPPYFSRPIVALVLIAFGLRNFIKKIVKTIRKRVLRQKVEDEESLKSE